MPCTQGLLLALFDPKMNPFAKSILYRHEYAVVSNPVAVRAHADSGAACLFDLEARFVSTY